MQESTQQVIQKIINQDTIQLYHVRWKKFDMPNRIKNIQIWDAIELQLRRCNHHTILKEISQTVFPRLRNLNLQGNDIVSIECISKLRAPNLSFLNLKSNSINNISSLRKINSKNLNNFVIDSNPIYEFFEISQGNWPKLAKIFLSYMIQKATTVNSINFCSKLQSKSLQSLYIRSNRQVIQEPVIPFLQRKMNDLKVYHK